MTPDDYTAHDALGLAGLVRDGEASPGELVDAAIAVIERHNPALNAVVVRQFEAARARAAEPGALPEGPLRGVPFLVKDLGFQEAGVPATDGSRVYKDRIAKQDSGTIADYRRAGLITCGRTNSPENGLCSTTEPALHGPSRNPWDPARTPGGSSGGSAAAVAAGMVPAASASDGGGSIRIPAACCGLFGLKPTRGLVSAGPLGGDPWSGLSCKHAVTRSVRDSAALLDATAGARPGDPYAAPRIARPLLEEAAAEPARLRIGFSAQPLYDRPVDAECQAALEDAARLCEELGHVVEEAAPDYDRAAMRDAWLAIVAASQADAAEDARAYLGRAPGEDDFEPWTHTVIAKGRAMSAGRMVATLRTMHLEGRKVAAFHETYDIYLTPTLAKPPVAIGAVDMSHGAEADFMPRTTGFSPYTRLANCTGQPSMSVPLYWSADGLPIGTMFTARFGDDAMLFRLAGQLERARPWWGRVPKVFG